MLARQNTDYILKKSVKSSANSHRGCSQDVNIGNVTSDFRARAPAKSTHHTVGPQRSKTLDSFPSHDIVDSNKSLRNLHRAFSHELEIKDHSYNLRLNVLPGSAPTSAFSSPDVSPQRSKRGEFSQSPFWTPQEFQSWLASETPDVNRLHTPDHSPPYSPSPLSPHINPRSPFPFLMHHNLLLENSKEWLESNGPANAHPLPLPPGALGQTQSSIPSQTVVIHQPAERLAASSTKSQWQKGKLIGRGTFGSVYVGTNRETGALCAMKEVDVIPDDPKSAECIKQLEQEIKVLRDLKHPNIVQYYGSERVDDHFYIYLEYVHPGSVNKYIREHHGAITEAIVRNFTRHILSGLAYLHGRKTIHRDIKCANLLVDASGIVKLADFGMAKHLTGLSYELSLKGSPYWMAPEVMMAVIKKDDDPDLALAVDIWSLGCTIIEMYNGKPPWSELEGPQAMCKVLNRTPPIPETLSPEGKDFLCCCFRRNPADRPSADMLLKHPFVRNSGDHFRSPNKMDKSQSPRNCNVQKNDFLPTSPGRPVSN